MSTLPAGKLPAPMLEAVLSRLPHRDPRLIVGPRLGEDAAVLDMGDRCLVISTDPVTFATDRIGWYSVHVNANDVAVLGAVPRWFFAVVLLPDHGDNAELAETVIADIGGTCDSLGVVVCGGHTEVTTGLHRPIVVGQMLGEVARERLVRKDGLRVGDRVLLTGGAALEGTALLAREKRGALARLPSALLDRAGGLLFDPGISVVRAAKLAAATATVHAMHDPTEGGIVTALWELARSAGCGLRVDADRIPVLPETRAVCELLQVDPLRLIASGSLLVAAGEREAAAIAQALEREGIPVSEIGYVVPAAQGASMRRSGHWEPIEPAERDEIARVMGA